MLNVITLCFSVFTFICASTVVGVVTRWNELVMSVANQTIIGMTTVKRSVWIWAMFAVCLICFITFVAMIGHVAKFLKKTSIPMRTLAYLDFVISWLALAAVLTVVVYFYHQLQVVVPGGSESLGSVLFDGVEVAFVSLTFVSAVCTTVSAFMVKEDEETSLKNVRESPVQAEV